MKPLKKAQVLKLAQAKWGKRAFVRDYGPAFSDGTLRPIDQEDRQKLYAARDALKATEPTFDHLSKWPDDVTLGVYKAALAKFQRDRDLWKKRFEKVAGKARSNRFVVGYVTDYGIAWAGCGDSWEQALENAEIKLGGEV